MDFRAPLLSAAALAVALGAPVRAEDFGAAARASAGAATARLRAASVLSGYRAVADGLPKTIRRPGAFRARSGGPPESSTSTFVLARGRMTVNEEWMIDPFTGEDVLHGRVSFEPGAAAPACGTVRLVQVARVEVSPGRDLDWGTGESNRNLMRTAADPARGVSPGWFVDHDAFKCRPGAPCSPYYRDSWANPDESADGASTAGEKRAASLADYPFGWQSFMRIRLETCARCAATGEFLGCAGWGGTWPETGPRTLRATRAAETPSPTFRAALARFSAFYAPAKP
jgi:hypothetical protein